MYRNFGKRVVDLIVALLAFIILSPVFLVVLILLCFVNKGSPFFFQLRPGKDEKIFKIIKFKTMTDANDADGKLLPDSERLTKIGAVIRKTSLDEIPQLINVIKGDMSLIGPRPLLVDYLGYYSNEENIRHSVRPGMTGLAQVNGRNTIGWDRKLQYDIEYVKNISFLNDVKIAYLTVKKVIKRDGVAVVPGKVGMRLDVYRKGNKNV